MISSLMGIKIVSSSLIPEKEPVLKLSDKVQVTPEFRADFDKWLLDLFGEQGVAYIFQGNCLMHPNNVVKLKYSL